MPGTLKVDYGTLEGIASVLDNYAETIEAYLWKVHKALEEDLKGAWSGDAALAFQQKWENTKPQTDSTVVTLRTVAAQLREISDAYYNIDLDMAKF